MSRAGSRICNLETVGKPGNHQVQVIYIFVRSEAWGVSYDMKAGRLEFSFRRNRPVWISVCYLSIIDCIPVWSELLQPCVEAQFKMVASHKL